MPEKAWRLAAGIPALRLAQGEGPPSGATAADLAAINAMPQVLRPHTADEVFVRGIYAVNDRPLHVGLVIPAEGVVRIAEVGVGTPVRLNQVTGGHDGLPVGRVFRSAVERDTEGTTWAKFDAFFPATDYTTEVMGLMDGGAIAENSVTITYDKIECSICHTDFWECAHQLGEEYDGQKCQGIVRDVQELLDTCLVWAGDAQGTRFTLAAGQQERGRDTLAALAEREQRLKRHPLAHLFAERSAAWLDRFFKR